MAIKRIKLENFQSHVDTEIALSEGLTVILGPTDQGKSAIIRALKWVLYNEPRGSDFITVGCKTCRVSLEMTDGTVITRERDGNKNRYILKKGDEEQVFEGFGANVPAEVIQAHGIPKIQIDTDKSTIVNLAEQLDPPFLISESGGNKAKVLGRLIGIHVIDVAQRSTLRDLRETQLKYEALNKEVEDLKEKLLQYEDLPLMEIKLNRLKDILSLLKTLGERYTKLHSLKEKLLPAEQEIADLKSILSKFRFFDSALKYTVEAEGLALKRRQLQNIRGRLSENSLSIERQTKIFSSTDFIFEAEAIHQQIEASFTKLDHLTRLRKDIHHTQRNLVTTSGIIEKTHGIPDAEVVLEKLVIALQKYKKLSLTRDMIKSTEKQISHCDDVLYKTSQIIMADSYLVRVQENLSKLAVLEKIKISLAENDALLNKGYDYLNKLSEQLGNMTMAYGQLLKRLAKCPTCLSPIDEITVKKILSEFMNTNK